MVYLALPTTAVDAAKWECGERSNLPIEGKNYCAAGDFRQSDIALTKLFSTLIERYQLADVDTSSLEKSQVAFEAYRENHCDAENKIIEKKSFHPMIVAQCKTRLSNLRISDLRQMQNKLTTSE